MPSKPLPLSDYRGPERRRYPRHTVQVPIEFQLEESEIVISTETTDLSRNGCYIQLATPLPLARLIRATLRLDGVRIQLAGRVVTRHPQFGNGIMFLDMLEQDAQALSAYLAMVVTESAV